MEEIEFKVGDILNFSWGGWVGNTIKFHNYVRYGYSKKNKWTHSAIIGDIIINDNGDDDIIVYEALTKGFTKTIFSKSELRTYIKSGNLIIGKTKIKLVNVKKNCDKYIGRPYGYLDILSIGLYLIFGRLSFTISTNSKQLICSEAVCRILYDSSYKKINIEKEFNKRYDLISPQDLYYSKQIRWDNM